MTPNHTIPQDDMNVRMARVEETQSVLHGDVTALKNQIGSLSDKITKGFEQIRQEQTRASHINLPTVFGGIALILTMMGGLWALAIQPIANQAIVLKGEIADVRRTEFMRIAYEHAFVQMLGHKVAVEFPDIPPYMTGSESTN